MGFTTNAIHRLLLSYGGSSYSKSVPMIIFIEPDANSGNYNADAKQKTESTIA